MIKKIFLGLLLLLLIVIPLSTLSINGAPGGGLGYREVGVEREVGIIVNPLRANNFEEFLEDIINFLFWVSIALAPIFFLIAAFYFLTAGGDPRQIETGKKIIIYTIIGIVIVIISRGLVEFIQGVF